MAKSPLTVNQKNKNLLSGDFWLPPLLQNTQTAAVLYRPMNLFIIFTLNFFLASQSLLVSTLFHQLELIRHYKNSVNQHRLYVMECQIRKNAVSSKSNDAFTNGMTGCNFSIDYFLH